MQSQAFRACAQLSLWDRKVDIDSEGAQVFTEFWKQLEKASGPFDSALVDADLWRVDFDPAVPLTTPRGFDTSLADVQTRLVAALAGSVAELEAAGVGLAYPRGQVQVLPREGFDIPIHGGQLPLSLIQALTWYDTQ